MNRIAALVNTEVSGNPALELAKSLLSADTRAIDVISTTRNVPQMFRLLWPEQMKNFERDRLTTQQTRLNEIAHDLGDTGATINTFLLEGTPFIEILHLIDKNGNDLVLTDQSIDQIEAISPARENTNLQLLRKCPVPVWVIGLAHTSPPKTIAAAIDVQNVSPENLKLNEKILGQAADIAKKYNAKLHLVQAWEIYGETMFAKKQGIDDAAHIRKTYEDSIRQSVNDLLEPFLNCGVTFECALLHGSPQTIIPAFVKDNEIELLVMGTVGRSGIRGLIMGNTAEKVLEKVACSVLALKPEGFQSPIF